MTLEVRDTTLDKVGDPTPVVGCRREAQVVVSVYEAKDLKHKVPPGVSVQLEVRCSCGTLSTARAATSQEGWAVFVIPEGSCAIASWALVVDHDRDPWVLTGPLRDNEIAFGSLTALHVVRPRGILQVGEVPAFETRALAEGDPPPQTLRISNVGNSALVLESVTVPAGVFRLSSEERRTKVRPGAAVDIQVEATPTATDAVQTATVTVVSSVGNGTAELRASAYELRTLVANVSPIAPDVDDADIHYTIEDPGGGVGRATISIHEIDPTSGAIGREIASFDGQPHAAGDNTFSWKGAVTHRDYQYGSVMSRGSAYRAKLIIARADGGGPRELTCDVAIKDVGELMIRLERHDGAALAGRATFEVKNVDSDAVVNATPRR
ncbi:MAG: hypothetical protein K0V04_30025 [Deltaproteobacteria bacterium]|nr:hypothetical protein [Deltaproteobacteria bacterium]